ncbi:transposase [Streptomyces albidoflavus]
MIDRALHLPRSCTQHRERCREAGIGDEAEFATKVQLARTMVRRAADDKIPFRRVTADAGYGYSKSRRHELKQADIFHVATTRHDTPSPGRPWTTRSTTWSPVRPGRSRSDARAARAPTAHGSTTEPASRPAPGTALTASTGP